MADDARISTALPKHFKTMKLKRRLGAPGCWSLVCLFLWVAENKPSGDLTGMTDEEIEIIGQWEGPEGAFVNELVAVRFLDGGPDARTVHDWQEHNPWAFYRPQRVENAKKAIAARWGKKQVKSELDTGSNTGRIRGVIPTSPHLTTPPRVKNKRASRVPLPEGFAISDRVKTWAVEKGFDRLEQHLIYFVGYAKAHAAIYADWDQAFMNAIREDWAKLKTNGNGNGHAPVPLPPNYVPPSTEILRERAAVVR